MSIVLELTAHDPLIARDGRPFGVGQGQRMRGLPWPLPSVVAGSFRTALVQATAGLDFTADRPQRLLTEVAVAGVFPVHNGQLYLPAPLDAVWHPDTQKLFRATPQAISPDDGTDLPDGLQPVMLTAQQAADDFKAATPPAWWPWEKYVQWLTNVAVEYPSSWFTADFLGPACRTRRDQVALDANRGAAAESLIFTTDNLHVGYLPRHRVSTDHRPRAFHERFAEVTLAARITLANASQFSLSVPWAIWHPLGGERRLVHWQTSPQPVRGWQCPEAIAAALANTQRVRLILATPAIFRQGWKPDVVHGPLQNAGLTLVGASIARWKAVSGWSLAPPRGPKPIRRMVPAGSVYFFQCEKGAAAKCADLWLHAISDSEQDQRDGFGLALWGIW
ncbi:MAG: type III-B CRISPR module-associated Cmr3 family protein [Gemmataceae bacterium]|nr:type III-B CRISPR module-associated protein Cmr3 [Gemmata sp.]MDW8199066.1 type III-B CRISPR module-associated Cmr3 family protein [Gemmataceae bacterium]